MSYRIEVSKQGRAACRGAKCKKEGNKIAKGELRLGVFVSVADGIQSWYWRHWNCVTPQVIKNMKEKVGSASELDGFSEIEPELQQQVASKFENPSATGNDEAAPADADEKASKEPEGEASEDTAVEPVKGKRGRKKGSTNKKRALEDAHGDDDGDKKKPKPDGTNAPEDASDSPPKRRASKTDTKNNDGVKRGRGRPKKDASAPKPEASADDASREEPAPATEASEPTVPASNPPTADSDKPKKRGRPKKTDAGAADHKPPKKVLPPLPDGQKRPRGRPRKVPADAEVDKPVDKTEEPVESS